MPTLLRLAVAESRLFLREPVTVFFALGFAPVLLVVFGLIPAFREPEADLGGRTLLDLYVPIVLVVGVALFAFSGLAPLFATAREKGVLRRLRTTPVRPVLMIAAQLVMAMLVALVIFVAVVAIARLAFGVPLPQSLPAALGAYLLTALAVFALGLLVAAVAPSSRGATAIATVLFFPLAFFGGLWIPRESMSGVLLAISDFSPLGAGVQSLQDAAAGQWPQLLHVAVLVGWTVVAGGLAARFFRWE